MNFSKIIKLKISPLLIVSMALLHRSKPWEKEPTSVFPNIFGYQRAEIFHSTHRNPIDTVNQDHSDSFGVSKKRKEI